VPRQQELALQNHQMPVWQVEGPEAQLVGVSREVLMLIASDLLAALRPVLLLLRQPPRHA